MCFVVVAVGVDMVLLLVKKGEKDVKTKKKS